MQLEFCHNSPTPHQALLHCQVQKYLPALVCRARHSWSVEDALGCLGCAVPNIKGEEHNRRSCLFSMLFERALNECLKYSLVDDEEAI